ncbi:hypothetical protein FQN54_002878 [Arachnomyces sp. PD_36]|nr:hypothetical protein FQN54_002878 [Arachnomyces sp. PD_36]
MGVLGRRCSGSRWICSLLSSLLLPLVTAQTIQASNSSSTLSPPFKLSNSYIEEHFKGPVDIAPLAPVQPNSTLHEVRDFEITGSLRNVDPANAGYLDDNDIAFLCCDSSAYKGNLGANDTIESVISSSSPAAVLLYSTEFENCGYTNNPDMPEFDRIFTLLDPDSAMWIRDRLDSTGGSETETTSIVPDLARVPGDPAGQGGGAGRNSAMIILYSITGIITALFLGIIVTGAIRAHRHPERYGPRTDAGRPRQSRARGLARAMLETIPIVKFGGDQDDTNKDMPHKLDVEMAAQDGDDVNGSRDSIHQTSTSDNTAHGALNGPITTERAKEANTTNEAPATAITETKPSDPDAETSHAGSLGCSICTDDFVKGQDIRVLPCNHKFHPECVDPWLVNVSGTCPLCRIDLNPSLSEHGDPAQGETEHGSEHLAAESTTRDGYHTHRRGLTSYIHDTLNARRMRDASVEERIATLRRLRREQQDNATTSADTNDEAPSRSRRLSTRLRDSLRIRTRQHEDDPTRAPTGS